MNRGEGGFLLKANPDYWLVDAADELELENHYFATIITKTGSSKNHQMMINSWRIFVRNKRGT